MPALDFRNTNALWCSVLAGVFARCGARHAVVSPGSRSSPLALAFASHPDLETIPVLDERSAAFFALGLARRHRRPTLLLCTSGTAAANYLPAVVEAREAAVPLLVLTADRPPELRHCAAGQAVDQLNLYGSHAVWFCEMPVPEPSLPLLRAARQLALNAWRQAAVRRGPVHLNCPFRDPLAPVADASAAHLAGVPELAPENFFAHLSGQPAATPARGDLSPLSPAATCRRPVAPPAGKTLLIAGPDAPAGLALSLANSLNLPLLADPLNAIRSAADVASRPRVIAAYDTFLRDGQAAAALAPERVIALGAWPTSKVLRNWLETAQPLVLQHSPTPDDRDGLRLRTLPLDCGDLSSLLTDGAFSPPDAPETRQAAAYLALWQTAEADAQRRLAATLDAAPDSPPALLRALADNLPPGTPVFLANSMTVRHAEAWPVNSRAHEIHGNRGANGIDGTLSAALGLAHRNKPAVLVTGDLAFLHDSNALLIAPEFRGSLTVLLLNNNGGGIFARLPVAGAVPRALLERYWLTPQAADIGKLCAAHAIPHRRLATRGELTALIRELPPSGLRVLEFQTG